MSTLVHADGGEVRVAGHDVARDPAAVRAAIGVTGQFSAVAVRALLNRLGDLAVASQDDPAADELSGLPVVHVRLSSDRARVLVEVWDRSAAAPAAEAVRERELPLRHSA